MSKRKLNSGFTLLEAIVSIVILGILATVVASFIRQPIDAYFDTASRAALTEAADGAMRRIARDLQAALPNSFRPPGDGSTQCFEFLPVAAGGRYRVERDGAGDANDDILNFAAADATFDVLGGVGLNTLAGTHHVVIYNIGIAGADAYQAPATNRAQMVLPVGVAPGGAAAQITLANAFQFPMQSPGHRFQVIPDFSVVYFCDAASGTIRRTTRGAPIANAAAVMGTCPAAAAADQVLVANVVCGNPNTSFVYVPSNATRDGQVEVMLTLTSPAPQSETIRLYDRVSVNNVP